MKIKTAEPLAEPFQQRFDPQRSIWDAIASLDELGASSFSTPAGTTVFSLTQPDVFDREQVPSNEGRFPRVRQNVSIDDLSSRKVVTSVTWVPSASLDPERFQILGGFDGTILEVYDDYFIARLVNKQDANDIQEEAEFPFAEIPAADQSLIAPGAMFYWYMGMVKKTHGQQSKSSLIRFRRLPALDEADIQAAKTRAEFLRAVLPLNGAEDET
jgi:hypothetical protein